MFLHFGLFVLRASPQGTCPSFILVRVPLSVRSLLFVCFPFCLPPLFLFPVSFFLLPPLVRVSCAPFFFLPCSLFFLLLSCPRRFCVVFFRFRGRTWYCLFAFWVCYLFWMFYMCMFFLFSSRSRAFLLFLIILSLLPRLFLRVCRPFLSSFPFCRSPLDSFTS